ncbi:Fucose permease [Austwickia chelonae]|nr:Fucose permease [Austwickia chelonae]
MKVPIVVALCRYLWRYVGKQCSAIFPTAGAFEMVLGKRRILRSRASLGRPFSTHLSVVGLANLADGVLQAGLPLLAITLTQSPIHLGLLAASVWLPWLILGLIAGTMLDRWDRRKTMLVALSLRAVLLGVGALLMHGDRMTIQLLLVIALLYGVTEVFTDISAGAQVPALVGKAPKKVRLASSRLLAVEQIVNGFVGKPVSGLLVAAAATWVFAGPAASVVLAVFLLAVFLRGPFSPSPDALPADRSSLFAELSQGLDVMWKHPVLRPTVLACALWNLASSAFGAVIVLWMVGASSVGQLTEPQWGLVLVALSAGAVAGSWATRLFVERWSEIRVLAVAWTGNALIHFTPVFSQEFVTFTMFFLLVGFFGAIGNVISGSFRARMIPTSLLGRVGGASRTIGYGSLPLGALTGGYLGDAFGISAVLAGVPIVMLAATLVISAAISQSLIEECESSKPCDTPTTQQKEAV